MTTLQKRTDDEKALTVILDCLRYAKRELGFLDAPLPAVSTSVERATRSIEGAIKRRRSLRRR